MKMTKQSVLYEVPKLRVRCISGELKITEDVTNPGCDDCLTAQYAVGLVFDSLKGFRVNETATI